jgi:ABC-type anion transport system duplicated permease subunit
MRGSRLRKRCSRSSWAVFGTMLSCIVVDADRDVAAINSQIGFRMAFTSSERARTGWRVALSYKRATTMRSTLVNVAEAKRCRSERCVVHNGSTQLFPTLTCMRTCAVGIPLVFVGHFALGLEVKGAVDDVY